MKNLRYLSLILFLLISTFSSAQVVNNGLVGFWPFNGNANDVSGNGHDGVVQGATLVADRDGNPNSAYLFDGINDYIEVPHDTSLVISSEITICAWIKRSTVVYSHIEIVRKGLDYFLLVNAGRELAMGIDGGGYLDGYPLTGVGEWVHVAGVFDDASDQIHLYLDGNLVQTVTMTRSLGTRSDNLRFGATENGGQFFDGAIDDILIYNKALTEQQIQSLYLDGNPYVFATPELCENVYCDGDNVGIGTSNTRGYKLAVGGRIIGEEMTVSLVENWPDHVFEPGYQLRTLAETERFILQNKHLPEIPNEKEVTTNGFDLGEMDAKLLQKIEELTLHLIEQDKKIAHLTGQLTSVSQQVTELQLENRLLKNSSQE